MADERTGRLGWPPNGPARTTADRRWSLWIGLALAVTLLLCSVPVVLTVAVADRLPWLAQTSGQGAVTARSPRPGDPDSVTATWIAERVAKLLDRQAAALLHGDRSAFLAVADPQSPAAAVLKRQFATLRALRVTVWRPRVQGIPRRTDSRWQVTVRIAYCFVTPDCAPAPVTVDTVWADVPPAPELVAVQPSTSTGDGPRPWEVSKLVAVVGERTLVATTVDFRDRLPGLLADAEHAAAVADRYAVGGDPPNRYRIFYAGKHEWRLWYGGKHPPWTAGYAVSIGDGQFDVVINSQDLSRVFVDDLLRHELTHVSSLSGAAADHPGLWWLIEGIAEYAVAGGTPIRRYDGLPDVRRLIADGGWTGGLAGLEPAPDAADWEVSARYGVSYLAVRCLIERFGERRVLEFFAAAVHDGRSVEQAARGTFAEDWSVLRDACEAYVRQVAG